MKRLPQLGMSIALFAALIVTAATPAFAAAPASGSADTSTGGTVHTYKLAISKAECDAVHQSYPNAECAITVTTTQTPDSGHANLPVGGQRPPR